MRKLFGLILVGALLAITIGMTATPAFAYPSCGSLEAECDSYEMEFRVATCNADGTYTVACEYWPHGEPIFFERCIPEIY